MADEDAATVRTTTTRGDDGAPQAQQGEDMDVDFATAGAGAGEDAQPPEGQTEQGEQDDDRRKSSEESLEGEKELGKEKDLESLPTEQTGVAGERRSEDNVNKENTTTSGHVASEDDKSKSEASKPKQKKTSVIFADRKITTEDNVDNISLYAMCRSWFKNETETDDLAEDKEDTKAGAPLPPPLPAGKAEKLAQSFSFEGGKDMETEDTSKDALFKQHMKRWKAIRKHKMKVKQLNSERFEERLKILFS